MNLCVTADTRLTMTSHYCSEVLRLEEDPFMSLKWQELCGGAVEKEVHYVMKGDSMQIKLKDDNTSVNF